MTLLNALRPVGTSAEEQNALNGATLEVLAVIPERCQHKQCRLYTKWREQLLQALCLCLPSVLKILESMVAASPGMSGATLTEQEQIKHHQLLAAVFECLQSWLSIEDCIDSGLTIMFAEQLAASPVLALAFQILRQPLVRTPISFNLFYSRDFFFNI